MYEVDCIKSITDIPDNISNLLMELKEFKEEFKILIDFCKDTYKIELLEFSSNRKIDASRCILLEITENPCSYSIQLFDNCSHNYNNKELKPIYEIEVEGENDFKLVKKDVKYLIEGKKGASFSSNYPL
jgi:hypothetical protein